MTTVGIAEIGCALNARQHGGSHLRGLSPRHLKYLRALAVAYIAYAAVISSERLVDLLRDREVPA